MLPNPPFFEQSDGMIVLPVFGDQMSRIHARSWTVLGCCARPTAGKTWADLSIVAYDKEERWAAYNEMYVVPINYDLWIAFLRTEYRGVGNESAWISRSVTTDGGYTWSKPALCFVGGAPEAAVLPDGGLAVGASGGLHITYDLGRTWTQARPPRGYVCPILLDQDTVVVGNGNDWGRFDVLRRIPASKK